MKPALTLLIVDDERDLVDSLARRLRMKGHHVFCAYSGEDALEMLKKADVDVVVTDLRMPGELSGRELYIQLQALGISTPHFIFMSGYPDELKSLQLQQQYIPNAPVSKLNKPFQVQELLDLIA